MGAQEQIGVLVVDDHAGIRAGLARLIDAERPALRCLGVAENAAQALALAQGLQPQVVLLDVNLGGEDGLALIPSLRAASACAVLVLTHAPGALLAALALRQGAVACLDKAAPSDRLLAALRLAARR